MRILICFDKQIKPLYNQSQLQGLVYNLFRKAGFSFLHDLPQSKPKFFNFSQLFFDKEKNLNLIVCSPIKPLIDGLDSILKNKPKLKICDQKLGIIKTKKFSLSLKAPIILKTETPIIIRVPKEKFSYYKLNLKKDYPYFYWRPQKNTPFEPFIKQLEDRVWKNYKLFTGKVVMETPIFSKFIYKKTVDLPYFKGQKKFPRIGTLWEFEINPEITYNLIRFILDTGLGELTSQGYGFVNIKVNG